ncbi:hypothetical protein COT47_07620 [Candidatus Woesearchaeota archaeon CG08_land_8_20_14_0_20_43_7]|nr:MAG: hypothetical protein COT47_07620 [Candidatus Woesearchaeota archaeon CG08_land_8_20_14_0_20_43_7]
MTARYDVLIIGAGPAGLACAKILAKAGKSVLVLEKNKKIGPKVCAGGLTSKDIKELNVPKKLIEFSFNDVALHVNDKRCDIKNKDDYLFMIDREELGKHMQQIAKRNGAKIKKSCEVISIKSNHIITNENKKIFFSYLVGADGSASIVRRHLRLPSKKIGLAMHYVIKTKTKKAELFFDSKIFGSFYAWVFPHKDRTSIGTGCHLKAGDPSRLKKRFESWYKSKCFPKDAKYEAALINWDYRGWHFDNIFLVGDAAGLASGFTGEGIYQAIISGQNAARKIIDPDEKQNGIDRCLKLKRKHELVLWLLDRNTFIRESLFRIGLRLFKYGFFQKKIIKIFSE